MILADTSAWIEFDRATESPTDLRLTALATSGGVLAVTEPVIMEMLARARDQADERRLRELLGQFELLPVDGVSDYHAAAAIDRRCRRAGFTPRGLLDCLIAAVAQRNDAELLTGDVDLRRIAEVVGITLDLP